LSYFRGYNHKASKGDAMKKKEPLALKPYGDRIRDLPLPPKAAHGMHRILKISMHFHNYLVEVQRQLKKRVPLLDFARAPFLLLLPAARVPPVVAIEFTNHCNLRCRYCNSPLNLRPKGFMDETTFRNLTNQIRVMSVKRIHIVGNGEATIHPSFSNYLDEISKATNYISLVSNWERVNEDGIRSVIRNVDVLNISVDGMTKNEYECSRVGGRFDRLLQNLRRLNQLRDNCRHVPAINIRLMLRPSQRGREEALINFWSSFGDVVQRQHVLDITGEDTDIYGIGLFCKKDEFPRCTQPLKKLDIHWNGNVPLCSYSHAQSGRREGVLLGNINANSLSELWNCELIRTYRFAHKRRNKALMPLCNGCIGG
jgi:MoaA/NifB/PqqE/SkfB family radical SAM enzyme